MVKNMYKLYKKAEKPIPFWVFLGEKKAFIYPGSCIFFEGKIFVEPQKNGEYFGQNAIWKITDDDVYFCGVDS